ncbi:low molecular weight phosphotyrosine protein phosphatase [Marinilabiliaceae bacterium JC017]|nr:low molecular weight phosphotyrosine protein phosphatase [Marinilabiliaceae bacterium JC017]
MDKTKILFVCLGNICRSPSAEAVMNQFIEKEGLSKLIKTDSAGVSGYHAGEPADARMKDHAYNRGYTLSSISRQIDPSQDFDYFDYVIAMDNQNIRDLKQMTTENHQQKKIYKMTEFCSSFEASTVPDPYYGGDNGFELVLDILEDACQGLLNHIKNGK